MEHLLKNKHRAYVAKFEEYVEESSKAQTKVQAAEYVWNSERKFDLLQNHHSETAEKIAEQHKTDLTNGLSNAQAASRLHDDGLNIVPRRAERSKWISFLRAFYGSFSPLLWALVVVLCIFWERLATEWRGRYNALVIAAVLVVVIVVTSVVPYLMVNRANAVLHQYDRARSVSCIVIREGQRKQIDSAELVIGDLVVLQQGHLVPADMRIVSSEAMEVDDSLFTGESLPRRVDARPASAHQSYLTAPNTVLLGTTVAQGTGTGIVFATGERTQLAKISQDCGAIEERTALHRELNILVISTTGFALLYIMFVVIYWAACSQKHHRAISFKRMILYLIPVMLATVPIGLPLSISLGMTLVTRRLTQLNVLPKEAGNMLTLGAVTMALIDKTGILTQNRSDVVAVLTALDVAGVVEEETKEDEATDRRGDILTASYHIATLCNESYQQRREAHPNSTDVTNMEAGTGIRYDAIGGKSLDHGLLLWAHQTAPIDCLFTERDTHTIAPFSQTNMMSATAVSMGSSRPDEVLIMVKGAPEHVLSSCTAFMLSSDRQELMTKQFRSSLQEMIDGEFNRGGRVVVLAQSGPLRRSEVPSQLTVASPLLSSLTFVSAVVFSDPPREEGRSMIMQLRTAGIRVALITGDSVPAAEYLANRVGIFTSGRFPHSLRTLHGSMSTQSEDNSSISVTGSEVDQMSQVEWDYVLQHQEIVFARTSPEHKRDIVKRFQGIGYVVSVTGDGVNDTPALHTADVGIAMNGGSDVAREVAEVVLLTDDISTIPLAVGEGRALFDNLQNVVFFARTGNYWSVLLPLLLAYTLGLPNPMPVFHMIVISCLTAVFGSVALMCEKPVGITMTRPPRDIRNSGLLDTRVMGCSLMFGNLIAFSASFNYFLAMTDHHFSFSNLLFSFWDWTKSPHSVTAHQQVEAWKLAASVYLVTVVVGQMFALLAIRKRVPYFHCPDGWRNALLEWRIQWPVVLAWISTLAVTLIFLYVPVFNRYCRTARVPVFYWGVAVGWGALWFVLAEGCKWFMMPRA